MQHPRHGHDGFGPIVHDDSLKSPLPQDARRCMVSRNHETFPCEIYIGLGDAMAACGDSPARRTLSTDSFYRTDAGDVGCAHFFVCVCAHRTCVLINGDPVLVSEAPGALEAMNAICDYLAPRVPAPDHA